MTETAVFAVVYSPPLNHSDGGPSTACSNASTSVEEGGTWAARSLEPVPKASPLTASSLRGRTWRSPHSPYPLRWKECPMPGRHALTPMPNAMQPDWSAALRQAPRCQEPSTKDSSAPSHVLKIRRPLTDSRGTPHSFPGTEAIRPQRVQSHPALVVVVVAGVKEPLKAPKVENNDMAMTPPP